MRTRALVALLFGGLGPLGASAQATVQPQVSTAGASERYVLRVENPRALSVTQVELHFPRALRVTAFEDVPGWTLQPLRDSTKRITGAVWTGSLAPERFVEFQLAARNPQQATTLVWPAFQTYSSGERIDWVGTAKSKAPAPVTYVSGGTRARTVAIALYVCIGAVIISLIALALSLRSDREPTELSPGD